MRVILTLFLLLPLRTFAAENSSYGKLLLKQNSPKDSKHQVALIFGSEIDNVYFQSQIIGLQYDIALSSYVNFNIYGATLDNTNSDTLNNINQSDQTRLFVTKMNYELAVGLFLKPLYGQVNFLSYGSLPFQIGPTLAVGSGEIESDLQTKNILNYSLGVRAQFEVLENIGLNFSLEENFRENFQEARENLTRLKVGIGYLF